jgi:REP element-mobilizing transposase RayT
MARPLRVEYPGAYYHVINRGNAGKDIFHTVRDHEKFLEYLEKAVKRFSIIIHTYCLMTNHYHLLIETTQPNLSLAIQWLNVSYAAYYNKKRQRSGHLFQGRFKSVLVEADEYFKPLSRYIHLNPVRARMVASPDEFLWSSYPAFIGKIKTPDWLETEFLLATFGNKKKEAAKNYRAYVEGVDIKTLKDPAADIIGGFILGDTDFANWVKDTFLLLRNDEKEIPQLKRLKPKVSLEKILQVVSDEFGCSKEKILEKGHKKNKARSLATYLARDLSGTTCSKLGNFFGGVSGAAITMGYNKITKEMAEDKRLKRKVVKLKARIVNT